MLTELFRRCGLTRDMVTWTVLKIIGAAGLLLSGVIDLHYWSTYLGLGLSDTAVHRILAGAAIILWLGGQYSSSNLPSKADLNSVTPPKEKSA